MTVPERVQRARVFLGVVAGLATMATIIATDGFGFLTPRFQPGVQYEFVHSKLAKAPAGDAEVSTRDFQIDQETIFTALAVGPRGERAVIEDSSLSPNTFVFTEVIVPQIIVGGRVFQGGYTYIETRYNMAQEEPQRFVPIVPPRR